ncbi:thiolase family protein [Puteibacter caeruleilacunae]|nr:thiolase family protein [Puteibacter caeruleilacunae]
MTNRICIIDGVRTPMSKAGMTLKDTTADELAVYAVRHLVKKTGIDPTVISELIMGNVSMPIEAANIARVIALKADLPIELPAYTVQRNCASGMESVISGAGKIMLDDNAVIIAGGVESMSNIPLIVGRQLTERLASLSRQKTFKGKAKEIMGIRVKELKPIIGLLKGLTDPVTGLIMGETAELLARKFGISREEQDEFALRSHQKAAFAQEHGHFNEEIVSVPVKPDYEQFLCEDEGIRVDQNMEDLRKLRPYFDRVDGTVTIGNSCSITDGAAVVLMMSERKANELGLPILGYVNAHAYAALPPDIMGLGPVFATNKMLANSNRVMADYDLVEINEAFAAQVIANERAFESVAFAKEYLSREEPLGKIDREKLNVNGGAIALGHPVGMSGTRLILHVLKELKRRDQKLGLATLCVGGGQGFAVELEVV